MALYGAGNGILTITERLSKAKAPRFTWIITSCPAAASARVPKHFELIEIIEARAQLTLAATFQQHEA